MPSTKRVGRPAFLWVAILGLLNLSAGEIEQPLPKDQVVCPHHGPVARGGPRRLRLAPSDESKGALQLKRVSLGDTIELVASFDRYKPAYWPTAIPGTKLADALAAQSVPGEYPIVPRAGVGVMLLMPRGAHVVEVVVRTSSGDVKPSLSSLSERLPAGRNLPAGSLALPIETLQFESGKRAEVLIRLQTDGKQARQAAGLQLELAFHPDPTHQELLVDDQEHSLGRAAVLFDVQDDGTLAQASVYDSIDRQRGRMGRDAAFLLERRRSASTQAPKSHKPLSEQELDRLANDKLSPEVVDPLERTLRPGTQPGASADAGGAR